MLYLVGFQLKDGVSSYTHLNIVQAENMELAAFVAQEHLRHYFGEDTLIINTNYVEHSDYYPTCKFDYIREIPDLETLIDCIGYIGEKPVIEKPEVVINVVGGVAALERKPAGILLEIRDYDTNGSDTNLETDEDGDEYDVSFYDREIV